MNDEEAKAWNKTKNDWDEHLGLKTPEYKVNKVQEEFIIGIMGKFYDRNSLLTRAFRNKAETYEASARSRLAVQHKILQRQAHMATDLDACPDFEGESPADKDKRQKEIEASNPNNPDNVRDQATEDLLMEFLLDLQKARNNNRAPIRQLLASLPP